MAVYRNRPNGLAQRAAARVNGMLRQRVYASQARCVPAAAEPLSAGAGVGPLFNSPFLLVPQYHPFIMVRIINHKPPIPKRVMLYISCVGILKKTYAPTIINAIPGIKDTAV